MSTIQENYARVLERIDNAAARAGRSADEITLVAVTKTWPVEVLMAAYEAGMRHFGENRAEELAEKRPFFEKELGDDYDITWHFIGAPQSRKTGTIADHADVFHALERMKIANRLARQLGENGRLLPSFLEVNVSGEASKSGFAAKSWMSDATEQAALRKGVETIQNLAGLSLQGLMTMAPWGAETAVIRNVFRQTRELASWLESQIDGLTLPNLSLGMTDDFEIGIEEGATHVRVGRALFGQRH